MKDFINQLIRCYFIITLIWNTNQKQTSDNNNKQKHLSAPLKLIINHTDLSASTVSITAAPYRHNLILDLLVSPSLTWRRLQRVLLSSSRRVSADTPAHDAHRPLSVSQRWSRASRGNRLPAELPGTGPITTSWERSCQTSRSFSGRASVSQTGSTGQLPAERRRHQSAWKRLTACTCRSILVAVETWPCAARSLRVCVCVCVIMCLSQAVRPQHDPTRPHAEDMTADDILLSKEFPKANLIFNFRPPLLSFLIQEKWSTNFLYNYVWFESTQDSSNNTNTATQTAIRMFFS